MNDPCTEMEVNCVVLMGLLTSEKNSVAGESITIYAKSTVFSLHVSHVNFVNTIA